MVARRLIACLDVRNGRVVKGVHFEGLRDAGHPIELARRYDREGIDELVMLDVSATLEGRLALRETIHQIAREIFIPLTVGGGIRSLDDARLVVEAGADKVSINSAALREPSLIGDIARCYGSQAVVVAIDAKREEDDWIVYGRSGTTNERRRVVAWATEAAARGAGEVLLTSIDRDGTQAGFDCALTAAVASAVNIPVIASGGAGRAAHFVEVFTAGCADAALAASIFHDGTLGIDTLKHELARQGVPTRMDW